MREGPTHFSFTKWEECPRCGIYVMKNSLTRDSSGLRVCPKCWDPLGYLQFKGIGSSTLSATYLTSDEGDILTDDLGGSLTAE